MRQGVLLHLSRDRVGYFGLVTKGRLTVGFLYGAARDRHLRKISEKFCLPAEKPKSAVDTQKTKKNRCLGIRG